MHMYIILIYKMRRRIRVGQRVHSNILATRVFIMLACCYNLFNISYAILSKLFVDYHLTVLFSTKLGGGHVESWPH